MLCSSTTISCHYLKYLALGSNFLQEFRHEDAKKLPDPDLGWLPKGQGWYGYEDLGKFLIIIAVSVVDVVKLMVF